MATSPDNDMAAAMERLYSAKPIVEFFVPGIPRTAGSKRPFQNKKTGRIIVAPDNPKQQVWSADVKQYAEREMASRLGLLYGPLGLICEFILDRPRSHYRQSRVYETVKPTAPAYKTSKPDTTKMVRCIEDALTKVIWKDDAQVAVQINVKRYANPGEKLGARIRVYSLE